VPPATAPTNTAAPTIKGKTKNKRKLTANKGTWTGTTPITYKYQWEACNAKGKKCKAIKGATKSALTLSAKDIGYRLEVVVTATNAVGSTKAIGKATPVIKK
jgi:hypothetical protein